MPQDNAAFREFLVNMANKHEEHVRELLDWKARGITIGAPTLEDIIEREFKAAENIWKAIGLLDSNRS